MSHGARVDSIDALKQFRAALFKFQESSNLALAEAEGDLHSTANWLDHEQLSHWQSQLRKRHELLERAKEALRMKQIYKDSAGRTPAAVEEEKAVRGAQARLVEAETKLTNVKKYSRLLQRETEIYKGSVQRFATTVQVDIPNAAATLAQMIELLESYAGLAPAEIASMASSTSTSSTPDSPEVSGSGKTAKSGVVPGPSNQD